MDNPYIRNIRSYPARPKEIIHKPIPLPPASSKPLRSDGWESIDRGVGRPFQPEVDDANDWGGLGLVTTETNVITMDEATQKKDSPTSYRSNEYYSAVFAPQVEKFQWIVPGVLAAGPHPFYFSFENNLKDYKKAGFKAILSTFEEPLDMVKTNGFQYFFLPTEEGSACDLRATCNFIDAMEKINKPVFVHSFSGNGRAATILAAYIMHKNWLTADEAISYMRINYNKHAIETAQQEDALHKFALDL